MKSKEQVRNESVLAESPGIYAPNKDQQVDQLSINDGVHELRGGQHAFWVQPKKWYKLVCLDRFACHSVELEHLYNILCCNERAMQR